MADQCRIKYKALNFKEDSCIYYMRRKKYFNTLEKKSFSSNLTCSTKKKQGTLGQIHF